MKELNLYKVWGILNRITFKESMLQEEQDIYVNLLGMRSNYCIMSFEGFLDYYFFKIQEKELCIFNDDKVAWEDYTVGDFSYLPLELLTYSDIQIDSWIESEVVLQLKVQEEEKLREKENLKQKIEQLQKRLESL